MHCSSAQSCDLSQQRSDHKNQSSDSHPEMDGKDLRIASDIWVKLAESEARMHLMVELGELKVGFPDVEQFCLDLESKYRATATGDLKERGEKSLEWQGVKACMKLKMVDETKVSRDLQSDKYKQRQKIDDIYGKNTRRTRNIVKRLRSEAAKAKKMSMMKFEEKMKHLRRKFRESEDDKIRKIPEALQGLELDELSIFDKVKYKQIEAWDYEVEVIGED